MPPAKKKEEPKKPAAKPKEEPKPAPKAEIKPSPAPAPKVEAKPAPPPAPAPAKPATPQNAGKPWILEVAKPPPPPPPPPRVEPAKVNACAKCGTKVGSYETVDSVTGKGYCSILCYSKRNG